MATQVNSSVNWWAKGSLRIVHSALDINNTIAQFGMKPDIVKYPGSSGIRHGKSESAGYITFSLSVETPGSPEEVFVGLESIVKSNAPTIENLIQEGARIDIYIGVHSRIMSLGFQIPFCREICRLEIPVGLEFFCG